MLKLLRAAILTSAFLLTFFVGSSAVHAQTSPYATRPACPAGTKGGDPATCTYSNGDTTTCVDSVAFGAGIKTTCTNKDSSVTTCVVLSAGENGESSDQCSVKNADGTAAGSTGATTGANGTVTSATDTAGKTTYSNSPATRANTCSPTNLAQCFINLPGMLFAGIGFLLLTLSSFFLYLSGVVFNWIVLRTVFQFAVYFGTSEGMLIAWGVLRDIGNIALLFGFVFMGIATILNTHNVEGYTARKALPQLIIFAVLLNFSLFASQGVIDVANGFSSVFAKYAGQSCDTATSGSTSTQTDSDCANLGISGAILSAVGMNHILPSGDEAVGALNDAWEKPYTYSAMLVLLSVLITITAVVLLAAAIMLAIRVVSLSLLMVTSPIGFAGMAIPSLHGLASDWWHRLINQAFFAPVYLLMLFLSLKLIENLQQGEATISDAILGNHLAGGSAAGNVQVLMVFIIAIGFMIAALMVAQKMGAYGASFATNAASSLVYGGMTRVSNLATGGLGVLMRRQAVKNMKNLGPNQTPGFTTLALMTAGTRMKSANMDMRRIGPVAGVLKAGGATSGANVASHATFADMQHQYGDIKSGKTMQQLGDAARRDLATAQLEDNAHHSTDGSLSKTDTDLLQNMSIKKLEELHGIKEGVEALAQSITQDQYDGLQKGDKLTDLEKSNLKLARDKRFDDTQVNVAPAGAPPVMGDRAQRTLSNMRPQDVAALSASTLTRKNAVGDLIVIRNLKAGQLAAIDPNKLSIQEAQDIKNYISANQADPEIAAFHSIVGHGPAGPVGAPAGTNHNASRRWSGFLP